MNTASVARKHAQYNPYRRSAEFRRVYQSDPSARRLSNKYFAEDPDTHPLLTGGRADLRPEILARLERNYLFSIHGKPAYLFRHHRHVAYAIAEAVAFGRLRKGATLVHFDAHPDMESNFSPPDSLRNIFSFMRGPISDMSFIWPMVELGYINEIYWFGSPVGPSFVNGNIKGIQQEFSHLKVTEIRLEEVADFDKKALKGIPADRLILDVDYDYFASVNSGHYMSVSRIIRHIFHRAGLLTQALSCPEYIETGLAVRTAVDTMRNL